MPTTPRTGPIVILTGAGISKESGLDTFRDVGGIWSRVNLEDVATPEGFRRDPALVQRFYNDRRRGLLTADVQPNAAHEALARLEAEWDDEVFLVTQNIDDLHERAGSRTLLHMHGELLKVRCEGCDCVVEWRADLGPEHTCDDCGRPGGLRPHVVWFGEIPLGMEAIADALDRCALFMSIGTSGTVYPAAGFVAEVERFGRAHTVELNMEASHGASMFRESVLGPATQVVPAYVDRLLADGIPGRG
ncbi:Sir2 family NAD+-dependent deacetylase [Roseospira navarrensis]|uniref:NAD-dependent protein deacylase n=1 Tax=Roseospira navarrensis TaxID=140058 RepID=A0A7X1ZHH4_9PROT|nr:Sir2 family NAD+-dependent deacetylase [Roseospira navarrensis]MQX38074.1 NAD-dependent protein deacylase [Roseospira navarrensis]